MVRLCFPLAKVSLGLSISQALFRKQDARSSLKDNSAARESCPAEMLLSADRQLPFLKSRCRSVTRQAFYEYFLRAVDSCFALQARLQGAGSVRASRRQSLKVQAGSVPASTSYLSELKETAAYISKRGRGILASDESNATTGKRLAGIGKRCIYSVKSLHVRTEALIDVHC